MSFSHNALCYGTNGGFLYECHCDDPEYHLEEKQAGEANTSG